MEEFRSLTDQVMNKQKKILIITILCVITLFIGTSYALLTNFDKADNVITIKSGNLTMTVSNDLITLNNKLPESDTEGLANAIPAVITLTNTGTMDIMKYEVKLIKENSTNISTLDDQYIKYAISTDGGTTYDTPNILTSNNNIIFTGYNLTVNESKTIYLKTWIDEIAKNNAIDKIYYASIKVELYQNSNIALINYINENITEANTIVEDNITYMSGSNTEIYFNYVLNTKKLWKITNIYPDEKIKMIRDDIITTIRYSYNVSYYENSETNSYVYQWLNEDFLDTLTNYENIIVTESKWNNLTTADITTKITEESSGVLTNVSPVGLLNSYEYYISYQKVDSSNSYLNIGYYWWILNQYSLSNVWYVKSNGTASNASRAGIYGIRPSVILKSGVQLSGGSGIKTDPYTIVGDKKEAIAGTTLLNTRSSGEYVKFNNELYRIVNIENNITKINKNDYVKDINNTPLLKSFSTSVVFGNGDSNNYWDYYLNNTWYNALDSTYQNMMVTSIYYLGETYTDYKEAICATGGIGVKTKNCEKTTSIWNGLVGLPRYGEMFANQHESRSSTSEYNWLITPYNSSLVWYIRDNGSGNGHSVTEVHAAYPSINIKSSIKITGGNGTKENPFEISL